MEKVVARLLPMNDIRVAEQVHRVMLFDFQQHFQSFGRHTGQKGLPSLDDAFVRKFSMSRKVTDFVTKFVNTDFTLFEQRKRPGLSVGPEVIVHIKS